MPYTSFFIYILVNIPYFTDLFQNTSKCLQMYLFLFQASPIAEEDEGQEKQEVEQSEKKD